MANLNTTFAGYLTTTKALGLSVAQLNADQAKQLGYMQSDYMDSVFGGVLNDLMPGYSDLLTANQTYTQQLKDASTLGLNTQQITEITLEHQLDIKGLIAQNNMASKDAISNATALVSTYTSLSTGFTSPIAECQTGDLSTASPTANFDDLRSQVETVGAQAQSGDTDAQSQLLMLLPEFLKQSAAVNGYNTDYATDQAMATELAESAKSVADQQLTVQQNILNAANNQISLLEQIAGVGTSGNANDKLVAAIKAGYTGLCTDQLNAIFESAGLTVTPGTGARSAALNQTANSGINTQLNDVFHALGVPGFATGGAIGSGMGGKPGVDSVPILTMPGKFVMRAKAVAALGAPTLNYMNSTGRLPANDNRGTSDMSDRIDRLTNVVYAGHKMMTEHLAGTRTSSARTAAATEATM